ncbi:hypothetical protein GCM10010967_30890 [Dyadobacter beijingensis]|uniref:Uncharacterized protein n=1 Tax=Dyadobacter beijingensis TaxID=365489 RepID=A0ABQ2I1V4_9BACT|nr:hypothetical protein [Dyadobacter beijingensis]GGM95293.1 hypothetical protein GCM10010967_30890 [Dyadobacter beijingensis]
MKHWIISCLACLAAFTASAQTFVINSGTSWSIPSLASTITKAGKNYEHIETSSASQTLVKVNALLGWTVTAHLSSTSNWDSALKLSVQRTGNGTGIAILSGGTTYIQLTSTPQTFFTGLLNLTAHRDNIPIQYKIEGLSVTLPVKTYTTTVTYTISGL